MRPLPIASIDAALTHAVDPNNMPPNGYFFFLVNKPFTEAEFEHARTRLAGSVCSLTGFTGSFDPKELTVFVRHNN